MDELTDKVRAHYVARAAEYDVSAGYHDAEAERLRAPLKKFVTETFRARDVLEVACGTGYWTEVVAQVAASVLATDASAEMIAAARCRLARLKNVECRLAAAYRLVRVGPGFTGGFAHWWLSHIPKSLLGRFLEIFHSRLADGAAVLFIDQLPYQSAHRRIDGDGNTIETRRLSDDRTFEIVKNFPSRDELTAILSPRADGFEYREATGSWIVSYRVRHVA